MKAYWILFSHFRYKLHGDADRLTYMSSSIVFNYGMQKRVKSCLVLWNITEVLAKEYLNLRILPLSVKCVGECRLLLRIPIHTGQCRLEINMGKKQVASRRCPLLTFWYRAKIVRRGSYNMAFADTEIGQLVNVVGDGWGGGRRRKPITGRIACDGTRSIREPRGWEKEFRRW